ncbi:quinoprotein relay system zinc metallohydrolase 2 [Denitrobaculum tricleocarpae]|uniref:quinoprotein relay system zinc metallohydrolase 2 n=1 Tax=Denitrobaculum tricleocarpae TaxID=2591009 RepID=UPI001FE3F992|nr:quinoprotein relay system zinc metallohydrolase 2 [Denitrobaculum tricleocarpae]
MIRLILTAFLMLSQSAAHAAEVTPAEVIEVAPGAFVRQGVHALIDKSNAGGIANIGFVIGGESIAVIDSGGSFLDGARLRAAIRLRSDLPIRYVINTHVHPDHVFGNAAFLQDAPGFIGHRNLARAMQARGAHYLEANKLLLDSAAFDGTEIIPPSQVVEARSVLDLGGRRLILDAYQTAHTDADLTVLDETTGTLWTGDLLFQKHLPVVDGRLKGWLEVMDKLKALPVARAVPGHGPVSLPWPEALAPQRAYLTKLAADLRGLIAEGKTMRHASGQAGQSEKDKWLLFEEFNTRNATAGFAELEWE